MKKVEPKVKLGILSGIGPLAGAYVYERVVKLAATEHRASDDDEYPDVFVVSHGISGVGNEADLNDSFRKEVIDGVQKLEAMGAECIGIACNTAHIYLDAIRKSTKADIIDIIEAVAIESAKHNKKYLLINSRSSKEQTLHIPALEKHGVDFQLTSNAQQQELDEIIGMVMAHKLVEAGEAMDKILDEAKAAGCNGVIAACTELPIALKFCKNQHDLYEVDGNLVLAEALVKTCYN